MMLLECPRFFTSPSRNQTPGTICFTVPGWASPAAIKNASVIKTAKVHSIHMRRFIVVFRSLTLDVAELDQEAYAIACSLLNQERRVNPLLVHYFFKMPTNVNT